MGSVEFAAKQVSKATTSNSPRYLYDAPATAGSTAATAPWESFVDRPDNSHTPGPSAYYSRGDDGGQTVTRR